MAKGKQARQLQRAIEKAGGRCEMTRNGHLRVFGPLGVTHISASSTGTRCKAALASLGRIGLGRVVP